MVQSAQPQLPILVTSMYVNKEGFSKKLSSGAKDQKQNGNQITVYLKLSKRFKLPLSYNAVFLCKKMNLQTFLRIGGINGASCFPLLNPKWLSIHVCASLSQSQAKQRAGHDNIEPLRSIHYIEGTKMKIFPAFGSSRHCINICWKTWPKEYCGL